jgi:hypothetical protein
VSLQSAKVSLINGRAESAWEYALEPLPVIKEGENKLNICRKCGLPIHTESLNRDSKGHACSNHTEWLHDDYREAWQVKDGKAQALHFAVPFKIEVDK